MNEQREMNEQSANDLDELSQMLNKMLTIKEKKADGIYFTPSAHAKHLYKSVPIKAKSILEPSCGSGEFLKMFMEVIPDTRRGTTEPGRRTTEPGRTTVTGIEYNKKIYDQIKDKYPNVINKSFLDYKEVGKHDLIIGNPPYYTTKIKYNSPLLYGRNNMYILFLLHSMDILKKGGVIAFIIPTNFMNSSYYNKIRKEIYDNWKIIKFVRYDDEDMFVDTKQKVFGLVIQKKAPTEGSNDTFVYNKASQYYFVFNKERLPSDSYTTLDDLGYSVGVGKVVWNQCKDSLHASGDTVLIYSSDISSDDNVMNDTTRFAEIKEKKDHRWLREPEKYMTEPLLVINRGYGNSKYKMTVGLIKGGFKYALENHVLWIKPKQMESDGDERSETELHSTIEEMEQIKRSLMSDDTKVFMDEMLGNNAVNCFELAKIIPVSINQL